MFTMVMYRGQEIFNILMIGCKNLITYIQQSIDNILQPLREFVKAYIDNIVSKTSFF